MKCRLILFMKINTALPVLKIVCYSKNRMLRLLKTQVWALIIGISLIVYIYDVCMHYAKYGWQGKIGRNFKLFNFNTENGINYHSFVMNMNITSPFIFSLQKIMLTDIIYVYN